MRDRGKGVQTLNHRLPERASPEERQRTRLLIASQVGQKRLTNEEALVVLEALGLREEE